MSTYKRSRFIRDNTLLFYLLLIACVHTTQGCKFPDYMHTDKEEPWIMFIPEPLQLLFDGDTIKATISYSQEFENFEPYTRTCAAKLNNDKYLVLHVDKYRSEYMCIQFHFRSASVVQISKSNSSIYKREYMCNDNYLQLDHRPIISVKYHNEHKIDCPFTGGFDMTVRNQDGSKKCNHRLMPLRLESECETGEGMTFKFQYADCVNSKWFINYREQKAWCLATWTQKVASTWGDDTKYTFIVLRPVGLISFWCMRISEMVPNVYKAYIFMDYICDPSEEISKSLEYFIINLSRRIFNNPCTDENEQCVDQYPDICRSDDKAYCPKTCKLCDSDVPTKTCDFAEVARGKWLLSSAKEKRNITIERSVMHVERYGKFMCQNVPAAEFPERRVLLQQFDNGCHPRYLCVDLSAVPRSNSVLKYQLGNPTNWPLFHKELLKQHVCSNDRFEGSVTTSRKPSMILVKPKKMHYTRCRLTGYASRVLGMVDSNFCRSCLFHNRRHRPKTLAVTHLNCTADNYPTTHDYQCVARLKLNSPALITKSNTDRHKFLCWIFPEKGRILAVLPGDCSDDTIRKIRFGDITPIHDWEVTENPFYCDHRNRGRTTTTTEVYMNTVPGVSVRGVGTDNNLSYVVTNPRSQKNTATVKPTNRTPRHLPSIFTMVSILYTLSSRFFD